MLLIQLQRADEGGLQLIQKVQRPSQKSNVSPDGFSAGQTADGLIDYRLKNRGGKIFFGGPLVDQGLNVRFGKYAAAGGDGVEGLVRSGIGVEPC